MFNDRYGTAINTKVLPISKKISVNTRLRLYLKRLAQSASSRFWVEFAMACRALLFVGNKFTCPCCGWNLRVFTRGGLSLRVRHSGYCPRCTSKARHRRDWLYLKENTNLFTDNLHLLHVSPAYALSRRLAHMANIRFVGVDIVKRPYVSHQLDITETPFSSASFDAVICIHVLEHIEDDYKAIAELYRLLKPGGWAMITVPIDLDSETYEDSRIVSPEERKKHFGEAEHVRAYGFDFAERLKSCGFRVLLDRGDSLSVATMEKYGLLDDENVFYCTKPTGRK